LGLEEQLMFPEIVYDQIDQLRGMDVSVVIASKTDKESFALLKSLGIPFTVLN
jgi:large subunit ribosomal protein L5